MRIVPSLGVAAAVFALVSASWAQSLPDLVPTELHIPTALSAPPKPSVQIIWAVANQGVDDARSYWNDQLYFSTQPFVDPNAYMLAYESGPSVVGSGETYWRTNTVVLPVVTNGTYYIIVDANAYNYLQESSTTNNTLAVAFTFQATPADLAPAALVAPVLFTCPPNGTLTVSWAVTNQGKGYAAGLWFDSLYLSRNAGLDASAVRLVDQPESGPVAAGGSYWRTNSFSVPVAESGTYYLVFETDSRNDLYEAVTNNNILIAPVTFEIRPPDLTPVTLQVPNVVTSAPNPTITLVWGVTNQGPGAAIGLYGWIDSLYLSTNAELTAADWPVTYQYETGMVPPGGSYWRTNVVSLPIVDSGTYYLTLRTDANDGVHESDELNNTLAVPVTFTIQRPDLVPLAQAPSVVDGPPFPLITLALGSTNQGTGPALGSWYDTVWFSTDTVADPSDVGMSTVYYGPVPPGGSYLHSISFVVPAVEDGNYYFIFASDRFRYLSESNTNNNTLILPVTIHVHPPDLAPIQLLVPTEITCPPNPDITFIWGITNQGTGPAVGNSSAWSDLLYFSTNSLWDASAVQLNSSYERGPIAAGESYWRTNALRVPVVRSGTYYFILKADATSSLIESDEGNNTLVVPISFTIQPPDLAPLVTEIPAQVTGPPNPTLALAWGVTNQGTGLAKGYWSGWNDLVGISTSPHPANQDINPLGYFIGGPLAAGESYWRTNSVRMPVTQSGTYYLVFGADHSESVYESDESNNVAVVAVKFTILPPDLAPVEFQAPAVITGSPNPSATLVWAVANEGIGPAVSDGGMWSDAVYLSRDAVLGASDTLVWSANESGPIPAGQSYWRTNVVRLPVPSSRDGFLIFKTDQYNTIYESNETNNTLAVPVRFEILPPDLTPLAFALSNSITGPPNPSVTFIWGVTNQGSGTAEPDPSWSWTDRVWISTNSVFDGSAMYVGDRSETGPVPAGGTYWRTNDFLVPVFASGDYYLFFTTDFDQTIHESDFANNTVGLPVTFTIVPPDLAPVALQAPPIVTDLPRPTLTVSWGVTNQGVGPAVGSWRDMLYLASIPQLDFNAIPLGGWSETGPVPSGSSYWRTNTLTVPLTESGAYYLILSADEENWIYESDMTNNTIVVPITFHITPPDLAPLVLGAPAEVLGPPNPAVTVVWGVTNQGTGLAKASWYWVDRLYLSDGLTPDSHHTEIKTAYESGSVAPGESYWRTNTVQIPVVQDGTYYLLLSVDAEHALSESVVTNNQIAVPVTFRIVPPDLAPVIFEAPNVVTGPPRPEVKFMWGVTNQGGGTAWGSPTWSDAVYLSSDPVLDANDQRLVWSAETGPVTPGGNYWRSQTVRVPVTESGDYFFIFTADPERSLYDASYSNNTVVVPVRFNITPPDLVPIVFEARPGVAGSGFADFTFIWGVTNQGAGPAQAQGWNWCDTVQLSQDSVGDWQDSLVFSACDLPSLPPGGSHWRTNEVRVPVPQNGSYYFLFTADANGTVEEVTRTNNTLVLPVSFDVQAADLAPIALQVPSLVTGPPEPEVAVVYCVTNRGAGAAMARDYWFDEILFSTTNVLDGSEVRVGLGYEIHPISVGDSYWHTNLVRLPATNDGTYYLFCKVDAEGSVVESDYSNNVISVPLNLSIHPPDLAVIDVRASVELAVPAWPTVSLVWGITNQGAGQARQWWDSAQVSTEPILGSNVLWVASFAHTDALAPGSTCWMTNTARFPLSANGQYYLFLIADANNDLHESDMSNNVAMAPFSLNVQLPDLAPVALQCPTVVTGGFNPTVTLVWGVTNQGVGPAFAPVYGSGWWDYVWLSKTAILDRDAISIGGWKETNAVAAGESYWRTNTVMLPTHESGDYYIIFATAYWYAMLETDSSNNVISVPIKLNIEPADLAPLDLQAPSVVAGQPYPELTVVWGVTNQGPGSAVPPPSDPYSIAMVDALYLSGTPGVEPGQSPVRVWPRTNAVGAGTSYWETNSVRLPIGNSGTYYLVFRTDAYDSIAESNEANNTVSVPIRLELSPPGDLAAVSFTVPPVVTGPGNPAVTLSWQVANQGIGPIDGSWVDRVYLHSPRIPSLVVATFSEANSLPPGAGYWRSTTIPFPVTESGNYQLRFKADDTDRLFDLNPDNDILWAQIYFDITGPPAVRLGFPELLEDGSFRLSLFASIGERYRLEASADLAAWTPVSDFVCTEDPMVLLDPQARAFEQRFYRVTSLAP